MVRAMHTSGCLRAKAHPRPTGRFTSVSERRGFCQFPPKLMLYTIRLHYSLKVDAASAAAAYKKGCARIKEEPSVVIRNVERQGYRPVWKMLLFGY